MRHPLADAFNNSVLSVLRGERGSVLVIALFMIFAAAVLGSVLAMVSTTDLQISGNQRVSTEALYAAEAGFAEATHRLSLPNPTVATVNGWTGNISLADMPPYDPNWKARIFLTGPGSAPAGSGSEVHVGTLQDLSGNYLRFSAASGTQDVLTIEHKWEDLNGNGVRDPGELVRYDTSEISPQSFTQGFPVEIVTVTGKAGSGTRTIQAEVTKKTVSANSLGALYIDNAIKVSGTPQFCGYDHMVTIANETEPMACFASHQPDGHKPGITTTGDVITEQGAAHTIIGQPQPTDTSSVNPWYTLRQVLGLTQTELQTLLDNADFTAVPPDGVVMDGVTYVQGNATLNSDRVGSGLFYCTGDLTINGDFIFRGLVYIEGDVKATGNPWVLGAMVVKGTGDFNTSAGNATILFSSDAIKTYLAQYLPMVQLSWREL
jgi:hypothetical protein